MMSLDHELSEWKNKIQQQLQQVVSSNTLRVYDWETLHRVLVLALEATQTAWLHFIRDTKTRDSFAQVSTFTRFKKQIQQTQEQRKTFDPDAAMCRNGSISVHEHMFEHFEYFAALCCNNMSDLHHQHSIDDDRARPILINNFEEVVTMVKALSTTSTLIWPLKLLGTPVILNLDSICNNLAFVALQHLRLFS